MLDFLKKEVECALYAALSMLLVLGVGHRVLPKLMPKNKKLGELMDKVKDMNCALMLSAMTFVAVLLGYSLKEWIHSIMN